MGPENRLDAKLLYRRLDGLLGAFDPARPGAVLMRAFLDDAFRTLGDDLRLKAGTLYAERRDELRADGRRRRRGPGDAGGARLRGPRPAPRPPARRLHLRRPVPGRRTRRARACPRPSAAVVVGMRPSRHVLWFALRRRLGPRGAGLRAQHHPRRPGLAARGRARARAASGRPRRSSRACSSTSRRAFPGYELAARSVAAEEVGGDFYDFVAFDDDLLGLSIGDASGHGLPAALLVRDVVTGLRMGLEKDLKMALRLRASSTASSTAATCPAASSPCSTASWRRTGTSSTSTPATRRRCSSPPTGAWS